MKWKGYGNSFNNCIDKYLDEYIDEYFSEQKSSLGRVKVELDLCTYATKANLKDASGVDTSKLA